MTTIDQRAAESARRVHDPLARAAITAELAQAASYAAGLLAGLDDAAKDRGLRVTPSAVTALCLIGDMLTEVAADVTAGDVFAAGLRVAA